MNNYYYNKIDGRDKDPKITAIKVIVIVSIVLSGAGICFCAFIGGAWSNPNIIVYPCFTLLILVNVSLLLFIKKSTEENELLRIAIIDNEKKSKEGMELFHEFRYERQSMIDEIMKETELRIVFNSLVENLHFFQDGEDYYHFEGVRNYYKEALYSFHNGNYDDANYFYREALRQFREALEHSRYSKYTAYKGVDNHVINSVSYLPFALMQFDYDTYSYKKLVNQDRSNTGGFIYSYRKLDKRSRIKHLEEEQEALSNSIEMLMQNIRDLENKLQEARVKLNVVRRNVEQTSLDINKHSQLQNMYDKLEQEVESLKIAVEMKASFVKFIDEAPESYDLNGYIEVFGEKYPLTLTHEQIDEAFGSTMLDLVENVN